MSSSQSFRNFCWISAAALLCLPWLLLAILHGMSLPPLTVALLAGSAIIGGAFVLSWGTELAERDIPQSLALVFLALVSVLPEYAVDLHFAWKAGKEPAYAAYAVANMTGANRLLIGLGWAAVVLIACARGRTREIRIDPRQRLEIRFLLLATLYSFLIPLGGSISLLDAAVLLLLFVAYVAAAMRSPHEEAPLVGPAAMIDREFGAWGRRFWVFGFFVFAAYAIFVSAEPFAESLVEIGKQIHVDEFLLVQWVAPLASEAPEFTIAILFALRMRGTIGIGALISSKVNQWTLLVGAIPIAYCLSAGRLAGLPLDARQTEELLLTSAQSLLATLWISDLQFSRREALVLAGLFVGQLLFPHSLVRGVFIGVYLLLAAGFLYRRPAERSAILRLLWPGTRSSKDSAS